jgi:hypothetical protein
MTTALIALLAVLFVLLIGALFLWGLGAWLVSKARKKPRAHCCSSQMP